MAPHSSTLAWKIPWTEEPGGLQFMGSLGVGHDWATSLSLFTFMHWRRKWQPTPVFLPGESHGSGSLVDCCLWGRTESDITKATLQQQQQSLNNSPSEHLFHCIWIISVQVLASARLWPPEGLGGTSFRSCRAAYNMWPVFVDQYMFVLDYFMADTITWLN